MHNKCMGLYGNLAPNSLVSGGVRVEKCYELSTCCVTIESSVERPCAEKKTPAER